MLLVSNDFPPKVGGIQNYLYELWSRLPYSDTKVITTKYDRAYQFDQAQDFDIERYAKILWPTPQLIRHVKATLREMKSDVVFIDPLLPTGLIAPHLHDVTKVLIIHGAEVTVPGRLYPSRQLVQRVARHCDVIVSAGNYAARELVRATSEPISLVRIPPGVDTQLFAPPSADQRERAREMLCKELGIAHDSRIVMSASRIVPRKGFDVAISALAGLDSDVHLVIVGTGRDVKRLISLAEKKNVTSRVHFLGRISQEKLLSTYHASDTFTMLCRDRWGSLEAEGFGIVFLEAASCGLPVVAGRSGGSDEALVDSVTGYVVDPQSVSDVRTKLVSILDDADTMKKMGRAGRDFVTKHHSYDHLAALLTPLVAGDFSSAVSFDG